MPADMKNTDLFSDNGDKDEHERVSALILAIRAEMKKMTSEELECLYGVIALMEKKKTAKTTERSDPAT